VTTPIGAWNESCRGTPDFASRAVPASRPTARSRSREASIIAAADLEGIEAFLLHALEHYEYSEQQLTGSPSRPSPHGQPSSRLARATCCTALVELHAADDFTPSRQAATGHRFGAHAQVVHRRRNPHLGVGGRCPWPLQLPAA
jgi:hypothetical protein